MIKSIAIIMLTLSLLGCDKQKNEDVHTKIIFNTLPAEYDSFKNNKWAIDSTICTNLTINQSYEHEYWRPTVNTNYISESDVAAIKFTNGAVGSNEYLIQFIDAKAGPETAKNTRVNKVIFSGFKVGETIKLRSKFNNGKLYISVNGKEVIEPISFTPTGVNFSSSTSKSTLEFLNAVQCN